MKPSDFQKTIQCQFDSLLKKVVRGTVRDYRKEVARRQKREIPFCELPEIIIENIVVCDEYESDYTTFNVFDMDIRIFDEELATALSELPANKRDILLMFYFLNMSDIEIGKLLKVDRSTSFRNRCNSLNEMRKIFKENNKNECKI